MKTFFLAFLFLSSPLLADSSPAYPPNPFDNQGGKTSPAFSAANAQAIYWINLIDQHQYGASWGEASGLVKDVTTREQWAAGMKAIRTGLGVVTSRKVTAHQAVTGLEYGTKGNFMIIKYATNYQRKQNMTETIVLMTEGKLGLWKVVSYKISSR